VRRTSWIAVVAVIAAVTLLTDDADARRLGGGRTLGTQRQSIAPPSSSAVSPGAAANPVMPANPSVAPRANTAVPPAAAAAPARSGMSRWLGPIAGIAAGLGIAALLSHFGLGEGFASMLMIALLVIGVVLVVRFIFMRRSSNTMQYAGNAARGPLAAGPVVTEPMTRRDERIEPVFGGGSTAPANTATTPPGFDKEAFLRQARVQFNALQSAWDAGDLRTLRDVSTPEMFAEIQRDLTSRGTHQPTEVVRLDADVLDVATEGNQYWVSVRFNGVVREDGADTPKPFDETWNLVKPVDGSSGWLLAGIQQNEAATTH
jgi:predicted lipid-binding transport protein (Tim44 family)